MIRAALAALLLALISGCANWYAGIAEYKVSLFFDPPTQQWICCTAQVINGKNIGTIAIHIIRKGDSWEVLFGETNVNGSEGIAAFGDATAKTTGDITSAVIDAAQLIP